MHDRGPQPAQESDEGQWEGWAGSAVVHLSAERVDFVLPRSRLAGQGAEHQPELIWIEPAHQFDGTTLRTSPVHGADHVQHRPRRSHAHDRDPGSVTRRANST